MQVLTSMRRKCGKQSSDVLRRPTLALLALSRAIGGCRLKESQTVRCPSLSRRAVTRSRGPTRRA
eukprot:296682-Pleurochrysis_carterae.AAC.1